MGSQLHVDAQREAALRAQLAAGRQPAGLPGAAAGAAPGGDEGGGVWSKLKELKQFSLGVVADLSSTLAAGPDATGALSPDGRQLPGAHEGPPVPPTA